MIDGEVPWERKKGRKSAGKAASSACHRMREEVVSKETGKPRKNQ